MFKKVIIGCDHTGVELKNKVIDFLKSQNLEVKEVIMEEDYVDVANSLANLVAESPINCGVLICGSGVGVSIVANRIKGVRASLCHSAEIAKLSRNHNNANVLCLGARIVQMGEQLEIVKEFFKSEFLGERHAIRVAKIDNH